LIILTEYRRIKFKRHILIYRGRISDIKQGSKIEMRNQIRVDQVFLRSDVTRQEDFKVADLLQ